jgi:hypothetical protein
MCDGKVPIGLKTKTLFQPLFTVCLKRFKVLSSRPFSRTHLPGQAIKEPSDFNERVSKI